jgi:hypothetical protein
MMNKKLNQQSSKDDFKSIYEANKERTDLWIRRIYVVAFNFYAWFWICRQIFVRHSCDWEEYALWTFTTLGMYYFVLDTKGLFLKRK